MSVVPCSMDGVILTPAPFDHVLIWQGSLAMVCNVICLLLAALDKGWIKDVLPLLWGTQDAGCQAGRACCGLLWQRQSEQKTWRPCSGGLCLSLLGPLTAVTKSLALTRGGGSVGSNRLKTQLTPLTTVNSKQVKRRDQCCYVSVDTFNRTHRTIRSY